MTLDLYDWTIQMPGRGRNGYIWGVARHVNGLRKRATWVRRMDALTAPTHRDALRVAALAGDDGVTAGSLSSELKATRAHMLNVLNELETQGFVKGTPAKGRRRPGVGTVYRDPTCQGLCGARRVACVAHGRRGACQSCTRDSSD